MPSFTESIKVDGGDMEVYSSIPTGSGALPSGGGHPPRCLSRSVHQGHGGPASAGRLCGRMPDLFHRITEDMLADGSRKIQHLSDPDIVVDLDAVVAFLRSNSGVIGDRLGVTGFCMGGRVTYLAAAATPHFKAAVPYYGGNTMVIWGQGAQTPFEMSSGIDCPYCSTSGR